MKKFYHIIVAALVGILIGYIIFSNSYQNAKPEYGDTGLPKNCRAIIKANINSYRAGEYSAEDVLSSIDRNCGEFGHSWE